jgi:transcriptional regulator
MSRLLTTRLPDRPPVPGATPAEDSGEIVSPTAQLRPVSTAQGERYAVAAIVVQEVADGAGTTELTELASRLADEARRLLLEDRPGSTVTAAVAISDSPAEPVQATQPTQPAQPAQRAHRVEPTQPAEPTQPTQATRPTQATSPTQATRPTQPPGPAGPHDGLHIDRHAYRVSVDGHPVELSYREFELLAFLAEHPGRVFSRRQLVGSVWNGADVGSRTVDVHVRRLRMKLGRYAAGIVTVRNVGYRYEPSRTALGTVA